MNRLDTAAVSWFASLIRSEPVKRFSLKICAMLKSPTPVSKIGSALWSRYGT